MTAEFFFISALVFQLVALLAAARAGSTDSDKSDEFDYLGFEQFPSIQKTLWVLLSALAALGSILFATFL